MEIRLFRGLSKCPANRNIIFRLYRFSFSLTYKILTCERTLIHVGQRYELHHRICNLRYGTHGYFWVLPFATWKPDFHRLKSLHAAQPWINKK